MRVIAEFVKNDLSEDQLITVVQGLVPALLQVLGNAEVSRPTKYDLQLKLTILRHTLPPREHPRLMSSDR